MLLHSATTQASSAQRCYKKRCAFEAFKFQSDRVHAFGNQEYNLFLDFSKKQRNGRNLKEMRERARRDIEYSDTLNPDYNKTFDSSPSGSCFILYVYLFDSYRFPHIFCKFYHRLSPLAFTVPKTNNIIAHFCHLTIAFWSCTLTI